MALDHRYIIRFGPKLRRHFSRHRKADSMTPTYCEATYADYGSSQIRQLHITYILSEIVTEQTGRKAHSS